MGRGQRARQGFRPSGAAPDSVLTDSAGGVGTESPLPPAAGCVDLIPGPVPVLWSGSGGPKLSDSGDRVLLSGSPDLTDVGEIA